MAVDDLNEGAENLRDSFSDLQGVLNELAIQLNRAANLTNDIAQGLQDIASAGQKAADTAGDQADATDKVDKLQSSINKKKKLQNRLDAIGKGAALAFVKAIGDADKETTQLGRSLNLSKGEAVALKKEFAIAASNAGDIAINSVRLAKANTALNSQLGTAFKFSADTLKTFSKLTEVVGLSAEAASSLAFQAERSGKSFREVEENALGASFSLQRQAGVALNNKEILEATGKVTGQVRANLGANPTLIAKAVTAAKLFGAELADIAASAQSLLNFESSIENELKAELITGKQLNLERARALSLAGDQEGLARELTAQAGNFSEFSNLNVLQQQELAAAFGMSSDKLADILFKQETQNMNAKQLRALGKGELADRLEQLDAQEKLALAQEKFQTMMGDLLPVVMPIVEGFGAMVEFLSENERIAKGLVGVVLGLAAAQKTLAVLSLATSTAKIFGENAKFGPVGLAISLAAIGGMIGAISATSQAVQDGIAPPDKGPFTITDRFGATAVTATGDGLAVSPNISQGSSAPMQPIVIQNNWDAFAASNGNGRRGLGGTQALQASPTFA
jgi:hypothetical protein